MNRHFSEFQAVARAFEPERYLAATLATEPMRTALVVLAAFAADLARVPATATQPVLGEIRLQWWRDSLGDLARGQRTGSPLADALGEAISDYSLPVAMLVAMTEARAFDLYDDPMPDQASLDGYLSKIEAIPFELALRVLGVQSGHASALAGPAGRVFGMTRLLAGLPQALAAGKQPVPSTMLDAYGVSREKWRAGVVSPNVTALVAASAAEIDATLASLRPQIRSLLPRQRVALLPLAVVGPYLRVITRDTRDPLRQSAELAPLTRAWRIAQAHMFGRF